VGLETMQNMWKLKKKIYSSLESIRSFQMREAQVEAGKTHEEVRVVNGNLENHKQAMVDISSQIKRSANPNESLDLELLSNRLKYFERLKDEVTHQEIIKKNLDQKYNRQVKVVNKKYQQSKLYERLVDKNNAVMAGGIIREEQKELDEICSIQSSLKKQ
jgi:flagellar biosynthesis chaperone FliJ